MLAIEIDGRYHFNEEVLIKDNVRQAKLESFGVQFLRFTESELKNDLLNVLRTIESKIVELVKQDPSIQPADFDKTLLD